jgi:hypothetical protein
MLTRLRFADFTLPEFFKRQKLKRRQGLRDLKKVATTLRGENLLLTKDQNWGIVGIGKLP